MKVILASDGSEHSMKAAAKTRWLAGLDPALEVIVLYVLPRPVTMDQAMTAGVSLNSKKYTEEFVKLSEQALAKTTEELGISAERVTQRVLIGVPGEVICDLAKEEGAELIVMGARGDSLVKALLLGSTSHRVLQLAPCPVLLVR